MTYRFSLLLALFTPLGTAQAQDAPVQLEVGYSALSSDDVDINLSAIYGTLSYNWMQAAKWRNALEFTALWGVADDELRFVVVELDPSYEVSYRVVREFPGTSVELYVRAMFARINLDGNSALGGFAAQETGAGLGAGVHWGRLAFGYTTYFGDLSDTSRLSVGYRF